MVYERGGEDVAERCVKTYYTMEGTVMKKSFRRILGFALALALMFSVFLPASAVTSFVTFGNKPYTITVSPDLIQDEYGRYVVEDKVTTIRIYSSGMAQHTGENDSWVYYTGSYDVSLSYNITATSGSYTRTLSYLHELMDEEGMLLSHSVAGSEEAYLIEVPENYPPCDYVAGMAFVYRDASWSVTTGTVINSLEETVSPYAIEIYAGSGRITYAPTGETYYEPHLLP